MARRIKLVKADTIAPKGLVHPWLHPDWGYKQCANKRMHMAFKTPDGEIVCPGCDRTCILPDGFERGQEFITVARPKE